MKNNKGFTLIELIVSLMLISVILVFMMSLFIKVRGVYNKSKLNSEYKIFRDRIVNNIYTDINNYGVYSVTANGSNTEFYFTFNDYRETELGQRITKVLTINNSNKTITYRYKPCNEGSSYCTKDITNEERLTNIQGSYPSDTVFGAASISTKSRLHTLKIPISDSAKNNYNIYIYWE